MARFASGGPVTAWSGDAPDHLVDTVVDGPVELLGLVGREDQHEAVGRLARAVQERVQGVAHVLRHGHLAALAQEG